MASRENFLIGTDEAGHPVYLPDAIRTKHMTIIGATGTGKTTLLKRLILSDIEHGTSCVVVDAHGDITQSILDSAPLVARERIDLIEVWDDRPFGLNLLEAPDQSEKTIDKIAPEVLLILKRMFEGEGEFRPQIDHDFDLIIRTLLANQGCTLAEALILMDDDPASPVRQRLIRAVTNEAQIASWRAYGKLKPNDKEYRDRSLRYRLSPLLASFIMRAIIGQARTTVPLKKTMDTPGQVLLISLPIGGSGSETQSKFLGNLFVCLITRLIFDRAGRPQDKLNRVHLYLDEYGRYATPTTARLFGEGRKYNFSLTVAHQTRADVADTGNEDAEWQAGTLVCFHTGSGQDADAFANSVSVEARPAEEAPRVISLTPLKQLLEGRHESERAQDLTRKLLVPIQDIIDHGCKQPLPPIERQQYVSSVHEGMVLIEVLLVDVMKHTFSVASPEYRRRAADILSKLYAYIGLGWENAGSHETHAWAEELLRRITEEQQTITGSAQAMADFLNAFISGRRRSDLDARMPGHSPPHPLHDRSLESLVTGPFVETAKQYPRAEDAKSRLAEQRKWYRKDAKKGYDFLHDLHQLCTIIALEPVFVAVPGQITRPAQSVRDARDELANNIKNLPDHRAYVRMRTDKVQVSRVELPDSAPPSDYFKEHSEIRGEPDPWVRLSRLAALSRNMLGANPRDRSRERYGTPRQQVEEQIRQRREQLLRPEKGKRTPEKPDAGKFNLAQETARAQKLARPQSKNPRDDREPPTIGRRSPKKP